MPSLKISASILSANLGKLNEEVASVEPYVDELHIDVMDGHFVPNLTFGQVVVKDIKTELPLNCHLMVTNPEDLLEAFRSAGATNITVHAEVFENEKDLKNCLNKIHKLGIKAGVSVKPQTSLTKIKGVLADVDEVLIMTVFPGFGGQAFMPELLPKIRELRKLTPDLNISVDGGINAETAKLAVAAGANILIAGSYIFHTEDRIKAIESLKP